VIARVGFQDEIDVPRMLALAVARGLEGNCDVDRASYFLSRIASQESGAGGDVSQAGRAAPVAVHGLGEESRQSARGPPLRVEGLVREMPLPTFVDAGDHGHEF